MASGITVVIPSIPPRRLLLQGRVLGSVLTQTLPPDEIIIAVDHDHEGAGPTRQRALDRVGTPWVAFLDDDDELLPEHLATLHRHAMETGADVVWPWFSAPDGGDPIGHAGRQWNPEEPHTFPITALVRTKCARWCKFPKPQSLTHSGEDWFFWVCLSDRGARFSHINEITWRWWNGHGGNTSGAPGRW